MTKEEENEEEEEEEENKEEEAIPFQQKWTVLVHNGRESLMFSVTYKIHPLARCIQAANSVCKDADIFRIPITILKQILYN
jgi:hypothetical protein